MNRFLGVALGFTWLAVGLLGGLALMAALADTYGDAFGSLLAFYVIAWIVALYAGRIFLEWALSELVQRWMAPAESTPLVTSGSMSPILFLAGMPLQGISIGEFFQETGTDYLVSVILGEFTQDTHAGTESSAGSVILLEAGKTI